MGYTWGQFAAYVRLARRGRARRQLEQLVLMNRALAGGKACQQLMDELRAEASGD